MAGGKERGMVFDIRGRRRHVVKVVYAILAVLMGASLFLVVGPVNIGSLLGNGGSGNSGAQVSIERAETIERKLKKSPEDPELLLSLTRARIAAGTSSQELTSTGEVVPTLETQQQYAKASEAWSEYLKAADEPTAGAAQQVAPALFRLGEISPNPNEILANFKAAAEAQQIVVAKQPNLGSLSKYALYSMYAGDYAVAEKAGAKVEKLARTKFERERFENQLEEVKKAIVKFKKQLSAGSNKGAAKEGLENPLSGIGSGGGGLAE
jgi:DNA repair ATPase RecN